MEKLVLTDGTDTYTLKPDTTLAKSGVPADAKKVGDELTDVKGNLTKTAEKDGAYPDLASGQLLSDNVIEDRMPYLYKPVGGGRRGTKNDLTIVGASVAWNQLFAAKESENTVRGITISASASDGTITYSGTRDSTGWATSNSASAVAGHKYLAILNKYTWTGSYISLLDGYTNKHGFNTDSACIYSPSADTTLRIGQTSEANIVVNITLIPQLFDLTAMFGSTIADYLYSLETAHAGDGVALFRKMFSKDYYPYSAPTLQSVSGLVSHDTVGFNQWDEEWEIGRYEISDGLPSTLVTDQIRSKNYIPVVPGATYYGYFGNNSANANIFACFYDANKEFLGFDGTVAHYSLKNRTITIPSNCHYIRFYCNTEYGTIYNHDICLNLSDTVKNGQYEPYVKHSYPLDSDVTLRGVFKLDANNNIYADGDLYEADGTVTRYWGTRAYTEGDATDGSTMITDGTTTVYKLATPTTETAYPYTNPQTVDPYGTEEFVSTGIVPVGNVSKYPENSRAKIDGLPWDFSTLIAPVEQTYKATRNYTAGELLIVNNVLYKVTANIANGGTITPNTNVTATTLSAVIAALA